MAHRNIARVVAPLALVAAVGGVVVVVQASRSDSTDSPALTQRTTATQRRSPVRARTRFYVVKAGDTLTVIAGKTKVSLETIQRLNPEVDPQALQTGQRLKLTP
jgi:LysM repeat protein